MDSKNSLPNGAIYTLAQSRTETPQAAKIITGNGSDLNDSKTAEGKGKRKLITVKMALSLIDIAKSKKDKKMEQRFWNSFHCLRKVSVVDGVLYGNYCKNRLCTVCTSIRKADLINKYYSTITQWEKPYFVTITVKSCYAKYLPERVNEMLKALNLIIDKVRKRAERGKGKKLVGIRSLESNFNPQKRWYNPHFHLIVKDKEMAETIIAEWINYWTPYYANKAGQEMKPITDFKHSLKETIKYGTKTFTEFDLQNKSGKEHKIYAKAYYNIIKAFDNHRLFDRFGFNLEPSTRKTKGARVATNVEQFIYIPKMRDWLNKDTGELLTKYCPPDDLLQLIEENIDIERY